MMTANNYLMALVAIGSLAFLSCEAINETSSKGVILNSTVNTLTISDLQSGDTLLFNTINSEEIAESPILIGDTAQVFYKGEIENETVATKVIITPAAVSPLLGAWVEPIPGIGGEQGILIEKGGVASSINMFSLLYKSWQQNGDTLILSGESIGNGQTITFTEKSIIKKIDSDSLILTINNHIRSYSKQQ